MDSILFPQLLTGCPMGYISEILQRGYYLHADEPQERLAG